MNNILGYKKVKILLSINEEVKKENLFESSVGRLIVVIDV